MADPYERLAEAQAAHMAAWKRQAQPAKDYLMRVAGVLPAGDLTLRGRNELDVRAGYFAQAEGLRAAGISAGEWYEGLEPIDQLAIATMPIPVVGDVTGLAADISAYNEGRQPVSPGNLALTGLGLLPFFPGMVVHHGTNQVFRKFRINEADWKTDTALGVHVAPDPEIANTFAMREGGNVWKIDIPDDARLLDVPQPEYPWYTKMSPAERAKVPRGKGIATDQYAVHKLVYTEALARDRRLLNRYVAEMFHVTEVEAREAVEAMLKGDNLFDVLNGSPYFRGFGASEVRSLDELMDKWGTHTFADQADRLKVLRTAKESWQEQGYIGLRYQNTAPMETADASDITSLIIFDPDMLKSAWMKAPLVEGGEVAGLKVGNKFSEDVYDSMAGFDIPEDRITRDVVRVKMSSFGQERPGAKWYTSAEQRTNVRHLAGEIASSRTIDPLYIGIDSEGPYVIEGMHRFAALQELGVEEFPAIIGVEPGTKIPDEFAWLGEYLGLTGD